MIESISKNPVAVPQHHGIVSKNLTSVSQDQNPVSAFQETELFPGKRKPFSRSQEPVTDNRFWKSLFRKAAFQNISFLRIALVFFSESIVSKSEVMRRRRSPLIYGFAQPRAAAALRQCRRRRAAGGARARCGRRALSQHILSHSREESEGDVREKVWGG